MTGKTHITIGTAAAIYILPRVGVVTSITLIGGVILGSLLPDIEHPKALITIKNKLVLMVLFTSVGIFTLTGGFGEPNLIMKAASIFIILAGLSSHRTFTHSILGLGFIIYISYLMTAYKDLSSIAIGIAVGTGLHILADIFTHNGTALFYPFNSKRIKLPLTLSTGGVLENVILVLLLGLIAKVYV